MIVLRDYLLLLGWIDSDRIVSLRDHCKIFYLKIGNATDGAGRFEADPSLLRAALYPKELHKVSMKDVKGMLDSIERAGLVRLYTQAGKVYGEVLRYRQRDKNRKVAYPAPPDAQSPPLEPEMPKSPGSFFCGTGELNRREIPPSPPQVGGNLNSGEQAKPSRPRIHRSPERLLKTLKEELKAVEDELTDILYPGGCAYKVAPSGGKKKRCDDLMKRRTEIRQRLADMHATEEEAD